MSVTNGRYIFLDVDGCLNHSGCYDVQGNITLATQWVIDPDKVALVHELQEATGAEIVLSSTWRRYPEARAVLLSHGLSWIDTTPTTIGDRHFQIQEWVDSHEVDRFVVIDDDLSACTFDDRGLFLQPDFDEGLTREHIEQAKDWLSNA